MYIHRGAPVVAYDSPISSTAEDVFYVILGGAYDAEGNEVYPPDLGPLEIVTTAEAIITNGNLIEGPTPFASVVEPASDLELRNVYAIKAGPTIASHAGYMTVSLRYSTDAGRNNINRSIQVPVIDQ